MAIPSDKSRIIITLPDRMKSDIEFLSIIHKRTPSKEIEFIVEEFFDKLENLIEIQDYDYYYIETYKPKQLAEKIVTWLTSFSITPNKRTSSFIQIFRNENITDKVIDMVRFNRKVTDEKFDFFIECLKSLTNYLNDSKQKD
jgi:hypothetical protein